MLCAVLLCHDLKKCQSNPTAFLLPKQQEQHQAMPIGMEIWGILASLDVLQPIPSCCPSSHDC